MRLVITLDKLERIALGEMAAKELRDPRDQIRFILRQALKQSGFLLAIDTGQDSEKEPTYETSRT